MGPLFTVSMDRSPLLPVAGPYRGFAPVWPGCTGPNGLQGPSRPADYLCTTYCWAIPPAQRWGEQGVATGGALFFISALGA